MASNAILRNNTIRANVIDKAVPNVIDLGELRFNGKLPKNTLTSETMYNNMKEAIKSNLLVNKLTVLESFKLVDNQGIVVYDSSISENENTHLNYREEKIGTNMHLETFFAEAIGNMGTTNQGICTSVPSKVIIVSLIGSMDSVSGYMIFQSTIPKKG
jgi:hypothetical protein